jgi:hypothetical protein
MCVHISDHLDAGRPGSAAKKAEAVRRISFALRNSVTSFFNRRISAWSAVDTPGLTPASISKRRIYLRRVSAPTFNREATIWIAAHSVS